MRRDLPRRQALGAQGDHHRVDAFETPLPFADRRRLERAVPVAGHVDLDRADLGEHRLGARAVTRVTTITAFDRVLVVAEMLTHLDLEPRLEHPLRQIREQPARPHQTHPIDPSLLHQLRRELLAGTTKRIRRRRHHQLRLDCFVNRRVIMISHCLSLRTRPARAQPVRPAQLHR